MAKRLVTTAPFEEGDMVTLQHGSITKQLRVLGGNGVWLNSQSLSYSFDQTYLELTVSDPGSVGHTAVLTGDALIVIDYS